MAIVLVIVLNSSLNEQLLKARSVEEDKLEDVRIYQSRARKERMEQINKELLSTAGLLEQQKQSNAAFRKKIAQMKKAISTEKKKVAKLESHNRVYDAKIDKYLIGLEKCVIHIQNLPELRNIICRLFDDAFIVRPVSNLQKNTETPDNKLITTFHLTEKENDLNSLKDEDVALTKKYKQERSDRIAKNTALLEKISTKKDGLKVTRKSPSNTSCSSGKKYSVHSAFQDAAKNDLNDANSVFESNQKHIQALQENVKSSLSTSTTSN